MIDRKTLWARIHMWFDNRSDPLADSEVAKYLASHPDDLATYVRIESFASAVRQAAPSDADIVCSESDSERNLERILKLLLLGKSSAEVAANLGVSEDAVLTCVAAEFGPLIEALESEEQSGSRQRLGPPSTADDLPESEVSDGWELDPSTDERASRSRIPAPERADEAGATKFDNMEKTVLMRALQATGGDKLAAAKLLGIGKSSLCRKLKRLGIE